MQWNVHSRCPHWRVQPTSVVWNWGFENEQWMCMTLWWPHGPLLLYACTTRPADQCTGATIQTKAHRPDLTWPGSLDLQGSVQGRHSRLKHIDPTWPGTGPLVQSVSATFQTTEHSDLTWPDLTRVQHPIEHKSSTGRPPDHSTMSKYSISSLFCQRHIQKRQPRRQHTSSPGYDGLTWYGSQIDLQFKVQTSLPRCKLQSSATSAYACSQSSAGYVCNALHQLYINPDRH